MSKSLEARTDTALSVVYSQSTGHMYRKSLSTSHTVLNAAVFQGAWLDLLVFHSGLAPLFIVMLAAQLWREFGERFQHLLLPLLAVFGLGIVLDGLLSFLGFFSFSDTEMLLSVIPFWLLMVWLAFTLSLPISFSWLLHKPSLAIGVFACMAPLSYIAGRHIGVIEFANGTILLIALAWAGVAYLSCRLLGSVLLTKMHLDSELSE